MAIGIEASPRTAERKFYSRMAIAYALIVFTGFGPSFYWFQAVSFPRPNPPLTALTITHGLVFTAWMGMIVAQTQLVAAGRRDLHMKLGVAGFGIGLLMLPLMYFTSLHSIPRGIHPPYATGAQWSALSLIDIAPFALLLYLGWTYRRDSQAHKRIMLIAAARMLEPALGRMPWGPPVILTNYLESFMTLVISIGPLIWWDWRQMKRLHWVTKFGFVLISVTFIVRYSIWATQGWHDFVSMLPG